jgi:rhamnose utilization protein RhaD (predicted bifunctional aldolase and dehydrogenase)
MIKKDLITFSKHIGNNLDLTQGAGGNTSLKDGETMWVKASGYCLRDADIKNIFVPVNYSGIIKRLKNVEDDPVGPEIIKTHDADALRPSIETTLHALMPHRYVIHIHSINVLANAVLKKGEEIFGKLLKGMKWSWVPYVRPGIPLTKAVQNATQSNPDVLILANHGMVFGAETIDEATQLLIDLEKRIHTFCRKIHPINMSTINSISEGTNYKPSKFDLVHSLAFDKTSLEIAAKDPLYPDHVVFLGSGPMPIMTQIEIREYLSLTSKDAKPSHKAIIIPKCGVLIQESLSEGAEVMLHCLANTLLRIQPHDRLRHLSEKEEAELLNWDAEKHRKKIQK